VTSTFRFIRQTDCVDLEGASGDPRVTSFPRCAAVCRRKPVRTSASSSRQRWSRCHADTRSSDNRKPAPSCLRARDFLGKSDRRLRRRPCRRADLAIRPRITLQAFTFRGYCATLPSFRQPRESSTANASPADCACARDQQVSARPSPCATHRARWLRRGFVAAGAGAPAFLHPASSPTVYSANEFLTRVNLGGDHSRIATPIGSATTSSHRAATPRWTASRGPRVGPRTVAASIAARNRAPAHVENCATREEASILFCTRREILHHTATSATACRNGAGRTPHAPPSRCRWQFLMPCDTVIYPGTKATHVPRPAGPGLTSGATISPRPTRRRPTARVFPST